MIYEVLKIRTVVIWLKTGLLIAYPTTKLYVAKPYTIFNFKRKENYSFKHYLIGYMLYIMHFLTAKATLIL